MPVARSGASRAAAQSQLFPLSAHVSGRYLVDASGRPFPILGRASWGLVSLTQSAARAFIDDTVARGYNAIEVAVPHHNTDMNQAPYANNGAHLPWSKRLDGGNWSGALSYGTIANEAPDFTQMNEAYWSFVDALLDYAASKGLLVLFFPAYCGFAGGFQGWMAEMVANGTTKLQAYGQAIGTRYATRGNIVWMLAGDFGSGGNPFTGTQDDVEDALITGLTGVGGKASNLYSAELNSESTGKSTATTLLNATVNLNGAYSFGGSVVTWGRQAYSEAAGPAFLLEEPYDEEGPDGTNVNGSATQPVRRFQWYGWLSSIAGYVSGNGYVWPFNAAYSSHLNTTGTQDMARLNAFVKSIEWWRLEPDGLGSIGALVTANKGTADSDNFVAAACTPLGDLLVAYLGPSSGNPTIDMTKLRGTVTARWFDPTNGTYQAVSGQPFANTGTRTFTDPGNNAAGAGDWVLRLDA